MNRPTSRLLFASAVIFLLGAGECLLVQGEKEKPKVEPEITNSIGMKLRYLRPGKFLMGSSPGEQEAALEEVKKLTGKEPDEATKAWRQGEGPAREVQITKGFYIGAYEVTQEEYEEVVGTNPSHFSAKGKGRASVCDLDTRRFPVDTVTFDAAEKFCKKLSERKDEKAAGRKYRLPTEAEWEYACRGGHKIRQIGKKAELPFHLKKPSASLTSDQANFDGKYPFGSGATQRRSWGRTCEVGSYKPNAWGLYDMHGNVWEWCSDWFDLDYYSTRAKRKPDKDPTGPAAQPDKSKFGDEQGNSRVLRGGSWDAKGRDCRSARRNALGSEGPSLNNIGFRVVMVLE
jgi:formylglycine-generating enzyme required for sulfatase activity